MFVAIRHNWSSSEGEWEIQPEEYSSLKEAKAELCHGMLECSEHCRGVEIKRVPRPPISWLCDQRTRCIQASKWYDKQAVRFDTLIRKRMRLKK